MAGRARWRLVCYDIREPARWRKVYKIVKGCGQRVQYSIFRCRLDQIQVERLRCDLAKVMAPEDALLIIDLCPSCASNVISRNHVEGWEDRVPTFRIVGQPLRDFEHATCDDGDDGPETDLQVVEPTDDFADLTEE